VSNLDGDGSNLGIDVSNFDDDVSNLDGDGSNLGVDMSNLGIDVSNLDGDGANFDADEANLCLVRGRVLAKKKAKGKLSNI
jgi:hypothetical protein